MHRGARSGRGGFALVRGAIEVGLDLLDGLVGEQVLADRVEHGGERDRHQRPDDAGHDRAGRDREDHRERVNAHGLAEQEGLQHVGLELLHADDDRQHDEGDAGAVRDEREQDGDDAGEQRTDDRDEGAEEDEHADREGERDLEDGGADPDPDGVDERDDDRGPDEGRELVPGDEAGGVDPVAGGAREEPHDPGPDLRPLVEEEEEGEERDEDPGDEVGRGETDRGGGVAEVAGVADGVLELVEVGVELRVGDLEGRADPVADLADTGGDLLGEVGEAARELRPDEGEHAADDEERGHEGEPGGGSARHDPGDEQGHRRQQGGEQHRDGDGHDDLADRPHRHGREEHGGGDEEQPPGPLARRTHAPGDAGGGVGRGHGLRGRTG